MSSAHSVCTKCEMKKSRQFWPVQSTLAPLIPCSKVKEQYEYKYWFDLRFSRVFDLLCLQTLVFQLQSSALHNVDTMQCTV